MWVPGEWFCTSAVLLTPAEQPAVRSARPPLGVPGAGLGARGGCPPRVPPAQVLPQNAVCTPGWGAGSKS